MRCSLHSVYRMAAALSPSRDEVALAVHERMPEREGLRHPHERVVDARVTWGWYLAITSPTTARSSGSGCQEATAGC